MPDTTSQDPLVKLGLIDISRIDVHDHPEGEEGQVAAPSAAGGNEQKTETPAGPDWESSDNPYKQAVGVLTSQQQQGPSLNEQIAAVRAKAAELVPAAVAEFVARGVDEKQALPLAQDYVNAQAAAVISELNRQADRQMIFKTGAVQEAAARKIAKGVSTKEVTVKTEELINEPTVEAMQARARTLVEERRGRNFETRKASGADRAESGSGAGAISAEVLDRMSPEMKIAYGIKHGQY